MNITNTSSSDIPQTEDTLPLYKILSLIVLFSISLCFALIPIKISSFKTNLKLIGIANAFSAGIFLSVGLIHLLPESIEKFNEITNSSFPYSFFVAILGYSLILFIEKVLFVQEENELDEQERKNEDASEGDLVLAMSIKSDSQRISDYLHSFKENEGDKNEENFKTLFSKNGNISNYMSIGKRSEDTLLDHPFDSSDEHRCIMNNFHGNSRENILSNHPITSYILVVAFSVHAIFEGVALGLQSKTIRLLYLFLAIGCHRWVEALTIGINFSHSNVEYGDIIKFILIFSSTTPIGILFGMMCIGHSVFIEGMFFAISSGSFIYISASEVVIEEFSVSKYKKNKFVFFIIGAVLIYIMTMFESSNEKK